MMQPMVDQEALLQHFHSTLDAKTAQLKLEGQYDQGITTLKARQGGEGRGAGHGGCSQTGVGGVVGPPQATKG